MQNKLESSLSYEEIFKNNSKKEIDLNVNELNNENENEKIYCIQTGENEMIKTLKIINDETNIAISITN